ncbi:MAG: glucosidase [Deltaproteobacteria bacterium HGW-Deltaproteobacteria-14]|nr:MAG: glucosidase [Deltaproteobacteria bacterium HGW-Deltaproteobacteria-14]
MDQTRAGSDAWRLFGPYLSERQWGTVREDYSPDGTAWDYFPHDHARSRAYRWGEDGLGGFSDAQQRLCLGVALWNTRDPILKERLFGLTGPEGNHGEDVKELYYFLDATPSHAWMRMLYKYPQAAYPYEQLVAGNRARGKADPELELVDTGAFADGRYFDVFIEYAKGGPEDVLMRVRVCNRGPDDAPVVVVPQAWFRNTWSWGDGGDGAERPSMRAVDAGRVALTHPTLGAFELAADAPDRLAFCDNDTHHRRLYGATEQDGAGFFKDGLHALIVDGDEGAVNPAQVGTKVGAIWRRVVPAGGEVELRVRLTRPGRAGAFADFDATFARREAEAEGYWDAVHGGVRDPDERRVQRQALAGMLWSKQYYYFDVPRWLDGDPGQPAPPEGRKQGRNHGWGHLNNADIISMPDTWEYPWYAAWDLAFHCLPLAQVDADFAKDQLLLLTREWYMHPNGQLPAYEWAFGDVNPPVHAWATWRVFEIDRAQRGDAGDLDFLERVLHKLLLNFTWWVNRKDAHGLNLFQGGFLGLDNIGVFDRSAPLPVAGHIEQADGTSWMAMYALNLLRISLELAQHRPVYEDIATKFFEHFLYIAGAMKNVGGHGIDLWDERDGFYYDVLHYDDPAAQRCETVPLRIRSLVGLLPLLAVETIGPELLDRVPGFRDRMHWFLEHRPELAALTSRWEVPGQGSRHLLSLLRGHRMKLLLRRMLDEAEFLSDYGVRGLSKHHAEHPYRFDVGGVSHSVSYQPGESDSGLFGGNSNWRGPIWMPVNYLLVESLRKFHTYYGDDFRVEFPTGSGTRLSLAEIAAALSARLCRLFLRDADGRRAALGDDPLLQSDPHFRDHVLFYEYFHGDSGRGVGASHQTGWTGLVATLLAEAAAPVSTQGEPS